MYALTSIGSLTSDGKESSFKDTLIRYVKPSHHCSTHVLEQAFQLRENRSPPEEYISFYYSEKVDMSAKMIDVKTNRMTFELAKNGGFLSLSSNEAETQVNTTRRIICFREYRNNKIGLHYVSESSVDRVEARSVLQSISNFVLIKSL